MYAGVSTRERLNAPSHDSVISMVDGYVLQKRKTKGRKKNGDILAGEFFINLRELCLE